MVAVGFERRGLVWALVVCLAGGLGLSWLVDWAESLGLGTKKAPGANLGLVNRLGLGQLIGM